jgi:carbon storage regulator
MLVLSRKKGESIVVDGQVTVTVLDVQGGRIRLGFTGPTDVPIHRQEVFERVVDASSGLESPYSQ